MGTYCTLSMSDKFSFEWKKHVRKTIESIPLQHVLIGKTLSASVDSTMALLTYNHDSEFKSFLDALSKYLIWKICKPDISFHPFCTLYITTRKQMVLQGTPWNAWNRNTQKVQMNLPLLKEIFSLQASYWRKVHSLSIKGKRQVRIRVYEEVKLNKLMIEDCNQFHSVV